MGAFGTPKWWRSEGHLRYTFLMFLLLASLDNTAIGVVPPLYAIIARAFGVDEALIGLATAAAIVVRAITSPLWGYWADRGNRKWLLIFGTLMWSVPTYLTSRSHDYLSFFLFQIVAAVGLGCIGAVGFSVITDLVDTNRRGLMLSLWGLSQGFGMGAGALLGGVAGAFDWRTPFLLIAAAGIVTALLFVLTFEPKRGAAEHVLSKLYEAGGEYSYRIELSDVPQLMRRCSNLWLLLQGFTVTLVYGSLIWVPRLIVGKVEAAGHSLESATVAGNLFASLFNTGVYFTVLAGYLGDRWQTRNLKARTTICALGVLGSIPFYVLFFLVPLEGVRIPPSGNLVATATAVVASIAGNGWVGAAFLLALGASALSMAEVPNRIAMISDVNLPEHRGTIFGLSNLLNGLSSAIGNGLTGVVVGYLGHVLPSPMNYAVSLSLFQLFFIPAGVFYYVSRTIIPRDIIETRKLLLKRVNSRWKPIGNDSKVEQRG